MHVLLVGAGLANASLLHFLRSKPSFQGCVYTVIDKRGHVGGNCYTEPDIRTGITIHKYGPHIFNANSSLAWEFMCTYLDMREYINKVKVNAPSGIYSFPINLHTINQFFGLKLNPSEAKKWMFQQSVKYRREDPRNFEEAMLGFLGKDLYEEFIYGYTAKQWGVEPSKLPASIAKRLPFRLSYNDNYYNKRYQGIPDGGYTPLFEKIFYKEDTKVVLNTEYDHSMATDYDIIVYTGSVDEYFNYDMGRLSYRTVFWERHESDCIFQGNAVINYTDINIPWTRINEPSFFEPWKQTKTNQSVYFLEFSKTTSLDDIPYYPVRLEADKELLKRYQSRSISLANSIKPKIIFNGRLGTYQYLDMDKIIETSAELANRLES